MTESWTDEKKFGYVREQAYEEAARVLDAPKEDLRVTFGHGHSGKGWYAWFNEYPREGSVYLDGLEQTSPPDYDISEDDSSLAFTLQRHRIFNLRAHRERNVMASQLGRKAAACIEEINHICRRYGFSLSHEDTQGAFELEEVPDANKAGFDTVVYLVGTDGERTEIS